MGPIDLWGYHPCVSGDLCIFGPCELVPVSPMNLYQTEVDEAGIGFVWSDLAKFASHVDDRSTHFGG